MLYKLVYPKNWNLIKFDLNSKTTILVSGKVPDFVTKFCLITKTPILDIKDVNFDDPIILSNLDFSTIIFNEQIDNDKSFYNTIDIKSMFTDWSQCTDSNVFYIETNFTTAIPTIRLYSEYIQNSRIKNFIKNRISVKILIWKHDFDLFDDPIKKIIKANISIIDIIEFKTDFPYYRTCINPELLNINENQNAKICHIYQDLSSKNKIKYRRYAINEMLQKNYSDILATNDFLQKYKLCIVSNPMEFYPFANKYIYDRTDNWTFGPKNFPSEFEILMKADIITCSSSYLYKDTLEFVDKNRPNNKAKVIYIPNGNEKFEYPKDVNKFETKTAIYIGGVVQKIDLDYLMKLCNKNPNWNFMVYAKNASELETIPDNMFVHETIPLNDLFYILCKCHVGLLTLKSSEWTKGMMSDKLFNYINARIPTAYLGINEQNYENYIGRVMFSLDDMSLDEIVSLSIEDSTYKSLERSWNDVTNAFVPLINRLLED